MTGKQGAMPEWNAADKAGSLRVFTTWLNGEARRQFLDAGTHIEILFFLKDEGLADIAPVSPEVERDEMALAIRDHVRNDNLFGVVHVAEAWTYIPRGSNDHTYRQIVEGEMAVSQLKDGDRTEALVVRMESRDGESVMLVNPIERSGKKPGLADVMEITKPVKGRFAGWFGA